MIHIYIIITIYIIIEMSTPASPPAMRDRVSAIEYAARACQSKIHICLIYYVMCIYYT